MRTTPYDFREKESTEDSLRKYDELRNKHERLGLNLEQILHTFLQDNNIPYLAVSYRVKSRDSFTEKIERKNYKNPIQETEDLLGLRIICYYQSDIEKIGNIIADEFQTIESKNKTNDLRDDQFGYRSFHHIVKIKKEWLAVPNFRGLEELRAEIQVRTVLMHAWAEIEHKLAYKKKEHIDKQFRRTFSLISANLEGADKQFELLKKEIADHIAQISAKADEKGLGIFRGLEMSKNNLQAFLDYYLKERRGSEGDTIILLEELISNGISFNELVDLALKFESHLEEMERDRISSSDVNHLVYEGNKLWHKCGVIRTILDIGNDQYFRSRYIADETFVNEFIQRWRKRVLIK